MDVAHPMWPWLAYAVIVVALAFGMLSLSHFLGERHNEPSTGLPYESGITPTGSARMRFPIDFYLIALFFIIFDVASAFITVWALRAKVLGWPGFISAAAFIGLLALALFYLCKDGALDIGPAREGEEE